MLEKRGGLPVTPPAPNCAIGDTAFEDSTLLQQPGKYIPCLHQVEKQGLFAPLPYLGLAPD